MIAEMEILATQDPLWEVRYPRYLGPSLSYLFTKKRTGHLFR
jgi:hypothetical protein